MFTLKNLARKGLTKDSIFIFLNTMHPKVIHIDGLVQERRNSSATAMEFRLSCTNPLLCIQCKTVLWVNSLTPEWYIYASVN